MPTYEYECDACGHQFEEFQKMGSKPILVCPECKKRKVRRLIGSGAGIIFKGSGFYETDYRSADYQKRAKEDSSKSSSASSDSKQSESKKNETKKESKPAAKKSSGSSAKKNS